MWDARLIRTLVDLAGELRGLEDPWWVVGSAAAALVGADAGDVADVDVLASVGDAVTLVRRWGEPCQPRDASNSGQFRSVLLRTSRFAMPVEVMAGLQVNDGGRWSDVAPRTKWGVRFKGVEIFVPSPAEQIAILHRFGRPKDLRRADALAVIAADAAARSRPASDTPPPDPACG
jgi:hypothetical protein